jgi:hypothetical protein
MTSRDACQNCRRPIHWSPRTGWLHGELPQYAHEPITCEVAAPVCEYRTCDHTVSGPDPLCGCRCHKPEVVDGTGEAP